MCRTKEVNGHTLDIGGGHFFHTKYHEIFNYVFRYLPETEFNYYKRVSKIELGDSTIDYPVESNVWQLPEEQQIEYLISIIRNGEAQGRTEPHNYEEWIRWKLGDMVCDNYMIPYNRKLWGVEPKEMAIDWLYKIPQVNVKEVLKYSLEREQDVNKFPAHIHFYYPKCGGFQRIVNALADAEHDKIVLNEKVTKLDYKDGRWVVNGVLEAKNVINTTPWNDLYQALGEPSELEDAFRKIKYNRIVVSLREREYRNNWHWRYVPSLEKLHHREFYIHNFAEDSRPDGIYLETEYKRFSDGGKLEAVCNYETDAAYPIPVIGHKEAITRILDYYRDKHLYGVGRWGQHEYQNADVSMMEAIKFVNAIE